MAVCDSVVNELKFAYVMCSPPFIGGEIMHDIPVMLRLHINKCVTNLLTEDVMWLYAKKYHVCG